MGFWDTVNEELKKAVEEGLTVVKDSAKIGRLRYRLYTLHKQAEKHFAEIGGIVYDMGKPPFDNPLQKPEVLKLIDEIKKIEAESESLEREIAATGKKETAK